MKTNIITKTKLMPVNSVKTNRQNASAGIFSNILNMSFNAQKIDTGKPMATNTTVVNTAQTIARERESRVSTQIEEAINIVILYSNIFSTQAPVPASKPAAQDTIKNSRALPVAQKPDNKIQAIIAEIESILQSKAGQSGIKPVSNTKAAMESAEVASTKKVSSSQQDAGSKSVKPADIKTAENKSINDMQKTTDGQITKTIKKEDFVAMLRSFLQDNPSVAEKLVSISREAFAANDNNKSLPRQSATLIKSIEAKEIKVQRTAGTSSGQIEWNTSAKQSPEKLEKNTQTSKFISDLEVEQLMRVPQKLSTTEARNASSEVKIYARQQQVVEQIDNALKMRFNPPQNEVSIQLNPKDLGKVSIKIQMVDDSAAVSRKAFNAQVVVENEGVREMLMSNIGQLKHSLQESNGLMIKEFMVVIKSDQEQSKQSGQQAQDRKKKKSSEAVFSVNLNEGESKKSEGIMDYSA